MTMANDYPTASDELPANAIAVIGMAGRFPGADSVTKFWDNLRRGEESIATLSEEALTAAGVSAKTLANPAYVRRAPRIDGIEEFDAEYFGMTPYTARMMDPQHRLFLQTAWHAFEDSGYDPATFDGAIGVFASSTASGYLTENLMSHRDTKALVGEGITVEMFNLILLNDKDYLATRVSHQFNLRGPSLTVQTACSSSLVAVHLACQSLVSGECDMVLAGAASIRVPHHVGYTYEPGAMVSQSGHCRPFDVTSDGTIFGSGVAAVILKPLRAALDDGDGIHAVIRGSAINNDGSVKVTYAAPALAGQAEVIAEAHAVADVDSSTIGFVETHGTGTPLGDPIEIEALRQAFEVSSLDRSGPCVLGSVKSNIGHLDAASGVTGLIKTILCLRNKAIPATVHYTAPNPELHLENTPFVVQNTYASWESDAPRRAGVSSFGVVETAGHAHVLRTLPGKQERHPICAWRTALRALPDGDVVVLGGGQDSGGIGTVVHDGCHPDLVGPPTRERERHVGQQRVFVARKLRRKRSLGILQGLGGAGGQQQYLRTGRGFRDGGGGLRRLLDDHVHVRATDTE
jgi:phthiocerol/phenolphthiocerol synthesis type-I polyketide synthase E